MVWLLILDFLLVNMIPLCYLHLTGMHGYVSILDSKVGKEMNVKFKTANVIMIVGMTDMYLNPQN